MRIYSISGRKIRTLVEGWIEEGAHRLLWDGRDDGGAEVPSGIYLCTIRTGGSVRKIRTLVEGWIEEGAHRLLWDGRDDGGAEVPSGIYLCTIRTGGSVGVDGSL